MNFSGIVFQHRINYSLAGVFLLMLFISAVKADLILTSPPRETASEGEKQYGPLADTLSKLLGEKVSYEQPKGWLHYQRDVRKDKYDIIFDGPHFISWRIKRYGHTPVAKLPGKLGFVVVTSRENKDVKTITDLVNVSVCGIAPPNLATMTILAELDDPVHQLNLITPKGGAKGVYEALKADKCKAAIFRDKFFEKKIPDSERSGLKVVYKSIPITNQGITVSTRVSSDQREKIAKLLTQSNSSTATILKRFAPKADAMIPASNDDYAEQYNLLTSVVFGWEIHEEYVDKP